MRLADERSERADRFLENAFIANWLVHGLGMLAMAALLLPTMPGGGTATDAERLATSALHPWRFRLGWLPWHLCAVADLALALALVRARWIARGSAFFVLVVTALAVVPDQYAQRVWMTEGARLVSLDPAGYLALERVLFQRVGEPARTVGGSRRSSEPAAIEPSTADAQAGPDAAETAGDAPGDRARQYGLQAASPQLAQVLF